MPGGALGSLIGSGLGIMAVRHEVTLTAQFTALGGVAAIAAFILIVPMMRGDAATEPSKIIFPLGDRSLLALGAIVLIGLLCEGAAADWTAVYLTERMHATPTLAGAAFTAFAIAMFIGRITGDWLVARFGGERVVRVLSGIAAVVLGVALVANTTGAALIGFATLGLGLAVVVPVTYSAAAALPGRNPGNAIAAIATCGWFGFLIGPPVIGFLADATNLSVALGVIPILVLIMSLSAGLLRPQPQQ